MTMVTARTLELMNEVARNLTGQNVVIRFKRPSYKRADGMTWRDMSGAVRVDLSPVLKEDPARLFDVFLHELAHVKLHAPWYTKMTEPIPASISHIAESAEARAVRQRQEREADDLAVTWKAYAAATWRNCLEATPLDSQLRTMTYY